MRRMFGILATAFTLGAASAAVAAPLSPQVDFRSSTFSEANNQHSFYAVVDGIGMTISAYRMDGGTQQAANLWWDSADGLGIRGGEHDEIDGNEYITITFDNTIGLSHVFLSDLFANESLAGELFDEGGLYELDNGDITEFDAGLLAGTDGDKANGEHVIELSKIIPVNEIVFRAGGLGSEYSLLGFTDPPIPGVGVAQIPLPPMAGLSLLGLALIGLSRRRAPHS